MKDMTNRLWAVTAAVMAPALISVPALLFAAEEKRSHLDVAFWIGAENFRWQEFDGNGRRLLTEQGPRLTTGFAAGNRYNQRQGWIYEYRAIFFTGQVDYDGQDSNGVFTASETNYKGGEAELILGLRNSAYNGQLMVDLLTSIGATGWRRDIANSINANGFQVIGLIEDYDIYYGRIGLAIGWPTSGGISQLHVGAKKPLSIDEEVDLFNVNLSPGKKWSTFARYEFRLPHGRNSTLLRLYYDSFRFSKSDTKTIGSTPVLQPKSNLDILGVSLGYLF